MTSLHQRRTHPTPVPGCFGCKAGTVGYDGKHLTKVTHQREDNATLVDHRDGRRDVTVRPKTIHLRTVTE